jgi:hypothetical protein
MVADSDHNQVKQRGYAMIYNELPDLYLFLPGFSLAHLGFYTVLKRTRWYEEGSKWHNTVIRSHVELGADCNVSDKTVRNYIKILERFGLISVEKIPMDYGLLKNVIYVHDPLEEQQFQLQWPGIIDLKRRAVEKAQDTNEASRERMRLHREKKRIDREVKSDRKILQDDLYQ